ncbi:MULTISPECIES: MlaE family ABC transporter permease [unclassified Nocardioides]|uniref:MlaE family ABC transporter permease n=1 Tax=unclassified Nocardioides TaxID=2615069 RepID=UPI0007008D15|nr:MULTISPECIES: ABC transporter permease [unclassified Nocardioides]KRA31080.1 ABC transporter permease [Nocardioides sp. Root614]KRA87700.1 ABC transporter permease [Nocardioides sp. Root682]
MTTLKTLGDSGSLVPWISRHATRPLGLLDALGKQARFYARALAWTPRAVFHYRREQVRLIAEVGMSNGTLAVVGGSAIITLFITFFAGITGGVQTYRALADLNLEALGGFTSAIINPRLLVPIVSGAALAATVGTGFTAQLGAMRISEEIDALEVMAVRSLPYLVSTRVVAGMFCVGPIFAMSLVGAWVGWKTTQVEFFGLSEGTYDHYMNTFMQPVDILFSFIQAVIVAMVVILIHTYYGYTASGGPAGVGLAVGRAVRTSLVAVLTVQLCVAMALYGGVNTFRISG